MKSVCIALVVCFAGAVTIGACSSSSSPTVVSNDAAPPTDTGSGAETSMSSDAGMCAAVGTGPMQYSTGNAMCDSCLGSKCCMVFTTCVDSPACLAALKCVTACVGDGGTTASCGVPCIGANMGSGTDALALSSCQSSMCPSEC